MKSLYPIFNIAICYNNCEEVLSYIKTVMEMDGGDKIAFAIVINSSPNEDIEKLNEFASAIGDRVVVTNPGNNLGYMNGLLHGYRCLSGAFGEPRYAIMGNTDIVLEKDFLVKLLSKNYENDVGCIAPSVVTAAGNFYDNPVLDERRSLKQVNRFILKCSIPILRVVYMYLSAFKRKHMKNEKTASRYVYEVHGCYFILTGKFAEIIKEERYGVLLYSEETFVAELIRSNGFRTYYDSEIELKHMEHSVTKLLKLSSIAKHNLKSMKYIRDRFYLQETE